MTLPDLEVNCFNLSNFTINLSNRLFSPAEISLIDKGLSFIPTVRVFPYQFIIDCQKRNIRNLKLRDYFFGSDRPYDSESFQNRFCPTSEWTPSYGQLSLETQKAVLDITNTTNRLVANRFIRTNGKTCISTFSSHRHNLTRLERLALRTLRNDDTIIIKPADKGGAVVIMDKQLYQREALRQLYNENYYRRIDRPLANISVPLINSLLDQLLDSGFINLKQLNYLRSSIPAQTRAFYILPKVHKSRTKWPHPRMPEGRPIVSDSGSETDRVSELIDFFLKPLATRHESYIRDTYDFIRKIRNQTVPHNAYIVTGDVTALYTNMHIQRSLDVVKDIFTSNPDVRRPDDVLLALLDIILRYNDFQFDDEFFLQTLGIAMGKRFAPHLANLYLLKFDQSAIYDYKTKPLLYFRFIDDTFFIWPSSLEDLKSYQSFLNNLIPDIRISFTAKTQLAEFLDTLIYKHNLDDHTVLRTRVFFKQTDTHQLVHGRSFHPKHTCCGVLKSQFIRFKRICSLKSEYDHACSTLYRCLKHRGYGRTLFRELKKSVWNSTFTYEDTLKSKKSPLKIWPVINYYNPVSTSIMKLTKGTISKLNIASDYKVLAAHKIHANLHNYLVRSKFTS